ncbi:MAG: O-phosphoserine--tRNA ligase, partial [Promethearchaeota archaeon]
MEKENYEHAWLESGKYLEKEGHKFTLQKLSKSHPVKDEIFKMRKQMLELGFEELILPMFVNEDEVYKEYGPEAALILDRLFYIAELPRPEIGISKKKIEIIRSIVKGFDKIDTISSIFRRYKKGEIEADDLIETMVLELDIEETQATEIIDKAFAEFKELKPIPTKKTLRSHTTALWFPVLSEIYKKKPLPLQYFIIGPKWRREQKIDATHLITSNTLSIAIMAEEITLEDAKKIAKKIALSIGFKKVNIEIKKATSKYYAPQTEFEIFVQHPKTKVFIEIGDGGFYSPVSLAKFGIDVPVVNIGFGVERITMIKTGESDIRKLVFPYYYTEIDFSDEELAQLIHYSNTPKTEEGKQLKEKFIKLALEHADDPSPVDILVWDAPINDKRVKVILWEHDKNARLLGVAARNLIWVVDGSIIARAYNSDEKDGVNTNISILEGIANEIAAKAEELSFSGETTKWSHRVRIPRHLSEINIQIDEKAIYFINSKNKKINIRGPVFIGV